MVSVILVAYINLFMSTARRHIYKAHSRAKKAIKTTHHQVATRPHQHLMDNSTIYSRWHNFRFSSHIHAATLVAVIVAGSVWFLHSTGAVFASADSTTWNFSNPSEYTAAAGLTVGSNSIQHTLQTYASDANTMALYHLDEPSGGSAADVSSYANNATVTSGTFGSAHLNNGLSFNGTTSKMSAATSASLALTQANTLESWVKLASSLTSSNTYQKQTIVDKGDYQLYFDNETGKVTYELANNATTDWTQVAGGDIVGSWDLNGKLSVNALTKVGSNIYAGIGVTVGDAEVWRWNGSTWTLIGGGPNAINNSWDSGVSEGVYALENDGTNVYAGLGNSAGDGKVWKWDGTTWTKIGGDGINSGWAGATFEQVWALDYYGGKLYAALGSSANDAEVWSWNGTAWTKIGGDSLNSGWTTNYEIVSALTNDGTNLYAGLGTTAGDSEVWRWNGSAWTKIGGDALNSSWDTTIETVRSLRYFGSTLYAGLGDSAGDADVWTWNGTAWTQIGGDGLNSSWAASTYEQIGGFGYDGSNIYAGLGTSNGDGEVWRWNGSAWTQIGGDGLNSSWTTAQGDTVNSFLYADNTLYAGIYDAGGTGLVASWNGSAWSIIGGDGINKSWGFYNIGSVQTLQSAGGYLYAGTGTAAGTALVWRYDGSNWSLIGGQGVNASWAPFTYEKVASMASYNGHLFVGLGTTANDAEVWEWNGSSWSQVGGDSLNSGWTTNFETVNALISYGGYLYAGLGVSANDAEVWRWNGTAWTKIGGDSLNSGWTTNFENVMSMTIFNGELVAGLGSSTGDTEVWKWSGSAWSKIGGDGVASSWNGIYQEVETLTTYQGKLYAGIGNTAGTATLWQYDGSAWSKIGGDDINSSWAASTFEKVISTSIYNGDMYVGLGTTLGDSDVWRYDGSSWSRVGGNGVNSSWASSVEEVDGMSVYRGKLYVGTGITANADAAVWSYGDNGYLQSDTATFDTNWHHIAATYDGTTMKIFVDGTQDGSKAVNLSLAKTGKALLIGSGYGGRDANKPQPTLNGWLDEVRISDTARASFNTSPYTTEALAASPNDAVYLSGVAGWTGFSQSATLNGGSINYRLSSDNGSSWQYWNGSAWVASANTGQVSAASVINDHIATFPVVLEGGIKWQAVMQSSGSQAVVLNSVTVNVDTDATAPETNASNVAMYRQQGGDQVSGNAWTNAATPYFSWDPGADSGAGMYGYCLYLGQSSGSDPASTKGMLGTSPASVTGTSCQFITTDTHLNLADSGILGSSLASSNSPYYLYVAAVDKAGNVVTSSSTSFQFRFDNTPPTNPSFITAPSNFISTKQATLLWATNGGDAPNDSNSGLQGLQYRIGASSHWYGDAHNDAQDASDLLANDGSYTTTETPDFTNLGEGNNIIYFRTWDMAGNVSSSYVTAVLKINTSSPSGPQNLQVSPTVNTVNSFAFSWQPPQTYAGQASNLRYCYTINTLPTTNSCTYTGAGTTNVPAGAYATQPGDNTFYVVAKDEADNINYATAASVTFTANTASPGMPLNLDVVDASIKSTQAWRLALTWDAPTEVGAGVATYRVYRSTDNVHFAVTTTTSGTSLVDTGLTQHLYYYKISACDSTNNCGAATPVVSKLPTGRYTSPAELLSKPEVTNTTTRRATITWVTDRASDSRIALGVASGTYSGDEVSNSDQVTTHTINLTNLAAGVTYFAKARWIDEDGNLGSSEEFSFTTQPAPVVKEVEAKDVGLSGATISFTSVGASKVKIYYGPSDSFGGTLVLNTSTESSSYSTILTDLNDATKYFFKVNTFDTENNEYESSVFSFTTLARPKISDLRFQPVEGEPTSTQLVTWKTNVLTTSGLRYGPKGGRQLESTDSTMTLDHSVKINDLIDNSEYSLVAYSRDASGNLATSDAQSFKTALDTRPPKMSEITVESTIKGTGSDARGQAVISWKTDEPSSSQVAFGAGASGNSYASKSAEDQNYTTDHVVIISDLSTSTVYHFQAISKDRAGNAVQSDDQSAIIGRATDSVLNIIFGALSNVFGFLK